MSMGLAHAVKAVFLNFAFYNTSQENFDNDSITDDRSTDPFRNPPVLSADGKKPRVKSNLKASKSLVGQGGNGVGQDLDKGRHKVEVATDNIEFVPPSLEELQPPEGSADNAPLLGKQFFFAKKNLPEKIWFSFESSNFAKFMKQELGLTQLKNYDYFEFFLL